MNSTDGFPKFQEIDKAAYEEMLQSSPVVFPGTLSQLPNGTITELLTQHIPVDVAHGYQPLFRVLCDALNQSQAGKGKERHANGKPFLQQPIMEIGRMVGPGYNIGQAMKKSQEAMRLPTTERKVAELLGAINYLASAVLLLQEGGSQ